MKKQITRISPHQTSKVVALIYFGITLLFVPVGIITLIVGGKERSFGLFFIFAPFIYGIMGYVFFGLLCFIYNFIAKRFGGVEFTTTEIGE